MKDGKFSHFLDGREENHSNWMRFVNCSRCEDEQNLVAYQFRGEMYYRTYKSINPGKELLVWYGESYAKDLGISLSDTQDRSNTKGSQQTRYFFHLSSFQLKVSFKHENTWYHGVGSDHDAKTHLFESSFES